MTLAPCLDLHPLSRRHTCSLARQRAMKDKIVYDLEDLVKAGRGRTGCPYFASKTLLEEANLVPCHTSIPRVSPLCTVAFAFL